MAATVEVFDFHRVAMIMSVFQAMGSVRPCTCSDPLIRQL